MLDHPCRVLLVEDEPEEANTIQTMLSGATSAFFKRGFELVWAETLAEAKQAISEREIDVVLLDLMLPDSRYIKTLESLQAESNIPLIVKSGLEDEVVAVKALELGACGYLPKIVDDQSLLIYAMRSAIERKQQLSNLEQCGQQQQELDILENFLEVPDLSNYGNDSLKQRMPDIFAELETKYHHLLDRFVEQKIYQVEGELSSQTNVLIEQLGCLQATPRDVIELHTAVLKQKQSLSQNKVFAVEGRYLLLELMGKLAAYYRRYYIGLNKLNLAQNYQHTISSD